MSTAVSRRSGLSTAHRRPVRPGAVETAQAFERSGVRLLLVTGDHPATAAAIVLQVAGVLTAARPGLTSTAGLSSGPDRHCRTAGDRPDGRGSKVIEGSQS